MDVKKRYENLRKKYCLLDGVQELFLYETYLQVCKDFFSGNGYGRIALYGAGENTNGLMNSPIWKQFGNRVTVIIDNSFGCDELNGIPVIKEEQLKKCGVEAVFISSWNYRLDMLQSVKKNFPGIEVFDPYEQVLEMLPQISIPFFLYGGVQKYQWFACRRRNLEQERDAAARQKLLRELIHGYFSIYDWVNLKKNIQMYLENDYADKETYACLERDVDAFLKDVRDEIGKREQGDCLLFLVDSLSKYVVEDMPCLSAWGESGIVFDNYRNEYPSTREVLAALLTGWHPLEDKTYLDKKIGYGDSILLNSIKEKQTEVKVISAARSVSNYSEINAYERGMKEDKLLTEIIFRGIEELLGSGKRQLIIMYPFDTVHPLHWNPVSSELVWNSDTSWEKHQKRFWESVAYTDDIMDFYLTLLNGNKTITKIVMGDHGINLKAEYAHDIVSVPVNGRIGLWDMEIMSPALIIWHKNWQPERIPQLVSTNAFYKILYAALENQAIHPVLEKKQFLDLEFVPGYDESWLKRAVKSDNRYLGLGAKGVVSLDYLFLSFEDGGERLFRIEGKCLKECDEELPDFIGNIGREKYEWCKFPKEILEDGFFRLHNTYYGKGISWKYRCVIRNLDLEITERCSLKCKDCMNGMQYYEKPQDIPMDKIEKAVDLLLENVDEVKELRILGGEPFMNKDLREITAYACDKEKIGRVVIYTNATILPQKEKLKLFREKNVFFYISDYGLENRQKIVQFENLLKEYQIGYQIHRLGYWLKPGGIYDNRKEGELLESTYQFCSGRDCITLLEGKLFACEFAANANRLGAIPDFVQDYVDLFGTGNLREQILDFLYGKKQMESCRWCNRTTQKIQPGVQIPHSLEYEKFTGGNHNLLPGKDMEEGQVQT